jgi:endonuclease III
MSFNSLVDSVLKAEGDENKFKPEVVELAKLLKTLNDTTAAKSGDIAKQIFTVGYLLNQPAVEINGGLTPLAETADTVENALAGILTGVIQNGEAYLIPRRKAESATITASEPTEQ